MFVKTRKVLAAITLCAFASGCSSYQSATLPRTDPTDVATARDQEVKVGQRARVTLVSGEVISGKVRAVTADTITVGRLGNYGITEDSVAASEIARLEIEHSSKTADIVAISAAGVLVVGTIFVAAYGDGMVDGLAGSD